MLKFIFSILFMLNLIFFNVWYSCVSLLILTFMLMFISINSNVLNMVSGIFGVDLISLNLILLSSWICSLMFMASLLIFNSNFFIKFFSFTIFMLMLFLMFSFISMDFFFFFFFLKEEWFLYYF